eukprot:TRINITY_DN10419_c0_g1_i1.p1 TRINITY_DN10419_c0_g1~~TRINITY_DN10419_c0_g1_i1.p1  ORF type:complete len:323 (+),score=-32.18 TRINITY_DN10419_c0_g1_i1:339-1307(+)
MNIIKNQIAQNSDIYHKQLDKMIRLLILLSSLSHNKSSPILPTDYFPSKLLSNKQPTLPSQDSQPQYKTELKNQKMIVILKPIQQSSIQMNLYQTFIDNPLSFMVPQQGLYRLEDPLQKYAIQLLNPFLIRMHSYIINNDTFLFICLQRNHRRSNFRLFMLMSRSSMKILNQGKSQRKLLEGLSNYSQSINQIFQALWILNQIMNQLLILNYLLKIKLYWQHPGRNGSYHEASVNFIKIVLLISYNCFNPQKQTLLSYRLNFLQNLIGTHSVLLLINLQTYPLHLKYRFSNHRNYYRIFQDKQILKMSQISLSPNCKYQTHN